MTCTTCGKSLTAGQAFCAHCGARAIAAGDPQSEAIPARLERALGGNYVVGELIGRGGFGEVFAATDRSLKRSVAIKVLRTDLGEARVAVDRFRREAESLARLRHPHIMPVFGIGEGEGLTFFVMPRIEGESLAQLRASGAPLPIAEACRVIAETADALASAHRAGVVHRDIKPDNILLEGPERHALLMDFGIAKSGGADGRLTATGMIIGTPLYMSPEQASGDQTGPASDIYSLGVVAYELLSGKALFGTLTSPHQVIAVHLTERPEDLHALDPRIPSSLARAVMRCLEKNAAARWPTVDEFARKFNEARADLPRGDEAAIPAAPPPLSSRVRRGLLAAAVVGAAVVAAYQAQLSHAIDAPRTSRLAAQAGAESFLSALDLPRYRSSAWRFLNAPGITTFLEPTRGSRLLDAPEYTRVVGGEWQFAFYTKGAPGHVRVTMGGPGWASAFSRVEDTTTVATAPPEPEAKSIEEWLRTVGWAPESLRALDSSIATVDGRETRTYRWEPVGKLVAAGDTAERRVQVTLINGRVTGYRSSNRPPAAARARTESESRRNAVVSGLIAAAVIALIVASLIVAQRRRTIRWDRALRVSIVPGILIALGLLSASNTTTSFRPFGTDFDPAKLGMLDLLLQLLNDLPVTVILTAIPITLCVVIAGASESLVAASAPHRLAGIQALHGIPRLRRSASMLEVGVLSGVALTGAICFVAWAVALLGAPPDTLGPTWSETPWVSFSFVLTMLGAAVPLAFASILLLDRFRVPSHPRGALMGSIGIGALLGLLAAVTGGDSTTIVVLAVGSAGLSFLFAVRGAIDGAIAWVALTLTSAASEASFAPHAEWRILAGALAALIALAAYGALRPAAPTTAQARNAST